MIVLNFPLKKSDELFLYADFDDLTERFGESEINQLMTMHKDGEKAVNHALLDATNQINSYLSTRYQTPIDNGMLTVVACNISRYRLWTQNPIDEVETRYKDDLNFLKDLANGKANLVGAKLLNASELASQKPKRATPKGFSHKGDIFGDDMFAKMPKV